MCQQSNKRDTILVTKDNSTLRELPSIFKLYAARRDLRKLVRTKNCLRLQLQSIEKKDDCRLNWVRHPKGLYIRKKHL